MGFLDDVRRIKQAAEAQPEGLSSKEKIARAREELAAGERQAFATDWASPGWEPPYVELLDVTGGTKTDEADLKWKPSAPEAYLAICGLRPEDVYGFWPTNVGDSGAIFELAIAYRDRPEYARGRERFAEWARRD